jgi:CheY-like chemotaxis protein
MRKLQIVMVDAEEADRRLMCEALQTISDCDTTGCRNASEAVAQLDAAGSADLVVISLDIEGAFDLVQQLHSTPDWSSIPVAILGNEVLPGESIPESASANYPSKPFDFDEHLSLAAELIALARTHAYEPALI